MNDEGTKVVILYGTQTGNSFDVAERTGRHLTRIGCTTYVCNMKDFRPSRLIEENIIVFVCSTTGNGEVPDEMKPFWQFLLRRNLPREAFSHINFCVFGLGDSSYEKFNVTAKKLQKRLLQLSCIELLPPALGDDQHELGYDAAFDPWIINLKNIVRHLYDLNELELPEDSLLPPKYRVQFLESNSNSVEDYKSQYSNKLHKAVLKDNKRITSSDHFQDVRLLKFDVDCTVHFEPGDVAVIKPENPKEEVEEFLSLLNVPLDTKFIVIPTGKEVPLLNINPYPCTVRECAVSYFDIMSIPRRSFFEYLACFSKDELEKEKLIEFTTAAGQEELFSYCNRPRRNILEVLKDFPNTIPHVPFEYLFDLIPCIRPRSFSIGSSLCCHQNGFHLVVAVVKYKTRLRKPRQGLCSNWLANLSTGSAIPFSVKKGSIYLPQNDSPVIMVGPGTGCAPFIAFIQKRICEHNERNFLFFGCRYKTKDFLFDKEWETLVDKNLLKLYTAFSRDQEDKIYVQHKIKENSTSLWELIHNEGAYIYIAGNAKQMPEGVKEAFLHVIQTEGSLDESSSKEYLKSLENNKRYQSETWA